MVVFLDREWKLNDVVKGGAKISQVGLNSISYLDKKTQTERSRSHFFSDFSMDNNNEIDDDSNLFEAFHMSEKCFMKLCSGEMSMFHLSFHREFQELIEKEISEKENFKCELCEDEMQDKDELILHWRTTHWLENKSRCPEWLKKYSKKSLQSDSLPIVEKDQIMEMDTLSNHESESIDESDHENKESENAIVPNFMKETSSASGNTDVMKIKCFYCSYEHRAVSEVKRHLESHFR